MATRKNPLKGLFKSSAKGRTYYYAWRNGPRIYAEFGTPEFLAEYLALRSPVANLDKQRFATWVILYKDSDVRAGGRPYKDLSDSTKRTWGPLLDIIKEHFGALPMRLFDRPAIRKDIRHWLTRWRDHPRMADMAKQVLSRVCSFIVAEGALSINPCAGIDNIYSSDRGDIIWMDAELDALCAVASPEVAHVARLAALTGIRQGDLLKLTWSRIGDVCIDLRTGKSRGKNKAVIPLYPALRALLTAIPKRGPIVLTNTFGQPWKTGFHSSWDDAVRRAGLADRGLHFHDLRGTAITKLYAAGFKPRQIAQFVGWTDGEASIERLLSTYVSRDAVILDAIRQIERHENENRKTDSKTGSAKSG